MDQKRVLEQNAVSGKLFLIGFVVLFVVIGLLLYLNPTEKSVFDVREAEFSGITGADIADSGNLVTGAGHGIDATICDQTAECLNPSCKDAAFCRGKQCSIVDTGRKWVWSYFPYQDPSVPPPLSQIGCCSLNQCVTATSLCASFDGVYHLAGYESDICGNGGNWDSCGLETSATFYNKKNGDPSDGGGYICTQTPLVMKWKFACNPTNKFKLENIYPTHPFTEICDGTRWRKCENDLDRNPIYHPNVLVYCVPNTGTPGGIASYEIICNNDIDDDNNGKIDEADSNCDDDEITRYLQDSNLYELVIKENDNYGVKLSTAAGTQTITQTISDVRVCDPDLDLETAKVCYRDTPGGLNNNWVIDSVTKLNRINAKPFISIPEQFTFIYEQPSSPSQEKQVGVILTKAVSTSLTNLPFPYFSSNLMLGGQRLMLTLNNEYYLLSHPTGDNQLFSLSSLTLTHIPTKQVYTAVNYPGTNWYTFTVFAGYKIGVTRAADNIVIRSYTPSENPAAYVIPYNLKERFEVQFSFTEPVKIIDPTEVGTLTVCQDDNSADPQQVLVCQDNANKFTLKRNNLTARHIGANDYGFIYEFVDGKKRVSVLNLQKPTQSPILDLHYNHFINSMIAGRRATVKFEDDLYLMQHPVSPTFSILNIDLKGYRDGSTTTFSPSGSEDSIEYPTYKGGKMYLQRKYGVPPPPFSFWALTQLQLAPISLEDELFTSFSSLGKIKIDNPNLGELSVNPLDVKFSSTTFRLKSTSTNFANIDLSFKIPKEIIPVSIVDLHKDALFYYHLANINQGIPVKTASIYRLYKLTPDIVAPPSQKHSYNDAFIRTFTGGKELALRFGSGNYYILGNDNPSNLPAFFDLNRLRLHTLENDRIFVSTVETIPSSGESKAVFTVPEGRIEITTSDFDNAIIFTAKTNKALQTETFFPGNYSIILATNNLVKTDATTFEICNQDLYQYTPTTDVCYYSPGFPNADILVDAPKFLTLAGGTKLLLEPNGQTGENKKVTIRRVLSINMSSITLFTVPDWNKFTQHIITGDRPVFNISNSFYFPVANDNLLSNFAFQKYPTGEISNLRNGHQITPVTFNGSFVLYDKVVFAKQGISGPTTARVVDATFTLKPENYLPDNGDALKFKKTTGQTADKIGVNIEGEIYSLSLESTSNGLAFISLIQQSGTPLLKKLFLMGDSRKVKLEKIPVEIKIENVTSTWNYAIISIRRLE